MTRIVMDTNVLVSGTFWQGASARIIRMIEEQKLVLVLSEDILREYDKVMHYDEIRLKVLHHQERVDAVQKIMRLGQMTVRTEMIKEVMNDPDDDKFLEAAIAGNAEYIITQDKKHILPLKEFRGIKIVTPEAFLELAAKFSES